LSRDAQRDQYERAGIPIVPWTEGEALDAVIEEVRTYRRHARPARA
jgi:heme O synthase-like polyprenyltransferase